MQDKTNAASENLDSFISPKEFEKKGFCVKHDFLTEAECERLLSLVENYRQTHDIPQIQRRSRERSLDYKVIDGLKIKEFLPEIEKLYQNINKTVSEVFGQTLAPLKNEQVGVNINITSPGGEYRWHYDRNKLTAILYLNSIEGGETECYPNYRIYFERMRFSGFQHLFDNLLQLKIMRRIFGKQVLLKPRQGTLMIMRADKCLHSVRPVLGDKDRINVILSYDAPDADFAVEKKLGDYLYNQDAANSSDPNYK